MERATRRVWRQRVLAWLESGQTTREFADAHELNPSTLSWWKWRLGADGELEREDAFRVSFVEVTEAQREEPPRAERIEVVVCGRIVRVPDDFCSDTLERILEVLEERR